MRYFDDMTTRNGFASGNNVPADADVYRELYVSSINYFAEKFGSMYRAVASYGGKHDMWIVFVSLENLTNFGISIDQLGSYADYVPDVIDADIDFTDDAMSRAVAQVTSMDVDQYIVTNTVIDQSSLDKALSGQAVS